MPIITSAAPASLALISARASDVRRSCSSAIASLPDSGRGGTLISRFCCPSSVVKQGSSIFSSTTVFAIAGRSWASTRFSSSSNPMCRSGKENTSSRSMDARASRQRRTFCRYCPRSAVVNGRLVTSCCPMVAFLACAMRLLRPAPETHRYMWVHHVLAAKPVASPELGRSVDRSTSWTIRMAWHTSAVPQVIDVDDPADPRLDEYRDLTTADRRPDRPGGRGLVIAEGEVVVRRLLHSPYPIRSLLGVPRRIEALHNDLADVDVPCYRTSADLMAEVVRFHLNRGVLAVADRAAQPSPAALIAGAQLVAVLEGVNDHE